MRIVCIDALRSFIFTNRIGSTSEEQATPATVRTQTGETCYTVIFRIQQFESNIFLVLRFSMFVASVGRRWLTDILLNICVASEWIGNLPSFFFIVTQKETHLKSILTIGRKISALIRINTHFIWYMVWWIQNIRLDFAHWRRSGWLQRF